MALRQSPVDGLAALATRHVPELERAVDRPRHDALRVELQTRHCVGVPFQSAQTGAVEGPDLRSKEQKLLRTEVP